MASDFIFHTTPFKHQEDEFYNSRHKRDYAILWEQGTGKSKLICDQFTYLSQKGEIDAVLIVAPNGVHRNWLVDQVPTHTAMESTSKSILYKSNSANTKKFQKEFEEVLSNPLFSIFAINYDAIRTKKGFSFCERFLKARTCMMVCDESHRIKSMKAKQSKAAHRLGKLAKYRRILTGTAVGNSPFDIYSQFWFLDPQILGFTSIYAFQNRYGIFEECYAGTHRYKKLVRHKNLDELQAKIACSSSRLLKDDVLDLPERLYTKRYYTLSDEQYRLYYQLKEDFIAQLASGEIITTQLALVRMLRLQQVVCGYLPIEGQNIRIEKTQNPRIGCLLDILEDYEGKTIIFARFTEDIRQITEGLPPDSFVEYHGNVPSDERVKAIDSFKNDPDCKYFVANPQAASEGLNLQEAKVVIYYSNSFKLIERMQSEDRAHRIGQKNKVTYIDITAPDTIDEHIVEALRNKKNIADQINGDKLKEWI